MSRHFPVIFVNRLISGAHDRTVNSFWRMNLPFMVFDTQKLAAKCFIDLPESMAQVAEFKAHKRAPKPNFQNSTDINFKDG